MSTSYLRSGFKCGRNAFRGPTGNKRLSSRKNRRTPKNKFELESRDRDGQNISFWFEINGHCAQSLTCDTLVDMWRIHRPTIGVELHNRWYEGQTSHPVSNLRINAAQKKESQAVHFHCNRDTVRATAASVDYNFSLIAEIDEKLFAPHVPSTASRDPREQLKPGLLIVGRKSEKKELRLVKIIEEGYRISATYELSSRPRSTNIQRKQI
ncbi:hypothetical protein EV421DRAFT_1731636 [Armillaria borealis]|uniref:Uncharacterized protein n=1 Tax=Armillaria borealis TaxID=47425 RepID=A0AA39K2A5_9AGAR|nr:hypothetical protein EV421DRAFT_1731636 [Armillaria borealis]